MLKKKTGFVYPRSQSSNVRNEWCWQWMRHIWNIWCTYNQISLFGVYGTHITSLGTGHFVLPLLLISVLNKKPLNPPGPITSTVKWAIILESVTTNTGWIFPKVARVLFEQWKHKKKPKTPFLLTTIHSLLFTCD